MIGITNDNYYDIFIGYIQFILFILLLQLLCLFHLKLLQQIIIKENSKIIMLYLDN